MHVHHADEHACMGSNFKSSILPKNTLACRLEQPGIVPPTSRAVEHLLFLLSYTLLQKCLISAIHCKWLGACCFCSASAIGPTGSWLSLSQPCGSATFQFQVQFFLNERGAACISWKQYLWQHSCAPLTIDTQRFRKRGHLHFLCAAACLELSLFVSHGGEAVLVIKYRYRLCRNSKWLCRYGKT